jgi:hypothetical protein
LLVANAPKNVEAFLKYEPDDMLILEHVTVKDTDGNLSEVLPNLAAHTLLGEGCGRLECFQLEGSSQRSKKHTKRMVTWASLWSQTVPMPLEDGVIVCELLGKQNFEANGWILQPMGTQTRFVLQLINPQPTDQSCPQAKS